jgi:hypothetical protein
MKSCLPKGKLRVLSTVAASFAALFSSHAAEHEADICIYGGTSGGVSAAVQAATMGKSVMLVNANGHLGGLSSAGLGWTDYGVKDSIQGLSREFYIRIGKKYSASSTEPMWTFEPKVAEAVFNDFVNEAGVPVYLNERLASAEMEGKRIKSITMESGDVFRAKVFIDCSYEGDLLAKAGVSYTVGREPNSKYGETINGIQAGRTKNQLPDGISPYVVAGNPASGLLPGVNASAGGANGTGDSRVQAYNYRMCLTNNAANRITVAKPPGYDEKDYEILFRAIEAGQTNGFWKNDAVPNSKTDSNNASGISTDFIGGGSDAWAEASHAQREQIAKAHENWQRGLIWTVQNHPRVPVAIRNAWKQWGLPADEFLDTDHWPHQIYVREARRMVSDYVMTELNCTGARSVTDSIALASYVMDSHNTQRIVWNGMLKNEGDVQVAVPKPYGISYRSIVPATGQCENLLVAFALSASHMGFGSCRMEPVLMMVGQSAASAACFAIDDGVPVQNVSYPKLKAQMLSDGQMPDWNPSTSDNSVIIDNTDTGKIETTGEWLTSSASLGYYGANYLHDNNVGQGQKTVRFRPTLQAGNYEVLGRWTAHENRAANVPVDIQHADGTTTVTENQKINGGAWVSLGTYRFAQGSSGSVLVRTTGANGYVVADAFEFVPQIVPAVSLWAVNASAREPIAGKPAVAGRVMLSRTGNTASPLQVQISVQGTATNGADFTAVPGSITFPAGASIASLTIAPLPDEASEGKETVRVSLSSGAGYGIDPQLALAEVSIVDQLPPDTPAGLVGTMVDGEMHLAWVPVSEAQTYSVKRSENFAGPFVVVASSLPSPSWSEVGQLLTADYFYVVSAKNQSGESVNSAPVHVFDQYVAWLVSKGKTPGTAGAGFAEDPDGDGRSNGFDYAVPKGLRMKDGAAFPTVEADVRQDAAVSATLMKSSNLVDWAPASWQVTGQQTDVDGGFRRFMSQDAADPQISAQFYRIELSR